MDAASSGMDVDEMDIDLGTDENFDALEAEAMSMVAPSLLLNRSQANVPAIVGPEFQQDKVHIRGLDNLATEDVKRFASDHYTPESTRIEWVDDTSANIQYASAELAIDALKSFTNPSVLDLGLSDPFALRKAKSLSTHPHVELYVRPALITDAKKQRARDASRFYLLNPEKDPRERRRFVEDRRGKGEYRDRRAGKRVADDDVTEPFDVNLYDDDPTSLAARVTSEREESTFPRTSSAPLRNEAQRTRRSRSRDELFFPRIGKGSNGRLRDRSASPSAGGDGRVGLDGEDTDPRMRQARRRSYTPPSARLERGTNAGKELLPMVRSNAGKELMGQTSSNLGKELMSHAPSTQGGVLTQLADTQDAQLFPTKSVRTANGNSRELFPGKGSNHRRKAAFDAADGTGDLFANRAATPLQDVTQESVVRVRSRDLSDRMTRDGLQDLASRITVSREPANTGRARPPEGFSIRGSAMQEENPGFSIRGAAGLDNPRVKELFPDRGEGNEGKELFGSFRSRGQLRKTAEDMFT